MLEAFAAYVLSWWVIGWVATHWCFDRDMDHRNTARLALALTAPTWLLAAPFLFLHLALTRRRTNRVSKPLETPK